MKMYKSSRVLSFSLALLMILSTLMTFTIMPVSVQADELEFTVRFDSNGGTAVMPVQVTNGKLIEKPVDPTFEGCTFLGWYKDAIRRQPWDFATDIVEENITLFAKWNRLKSPFETYGKLQVKTLPASIPEGDGKPWSGNLTYICDERGNPVQLRGMASGAFQWDVYKWVVYYPFQVMNGMAKDWKCDIIRLAMYVQETGYADDPRKILDYMETAIQAITANGMYVLVDWHTHRPGWADEPVYVDAGLRPTPGCPDFSITEMPEDFQAIAAAHPDWVGMQVFLAYIAKKYGHQGNILYEPGNEPNDSAIGDNGAGPQQNWQEGWDKVLQPYFQKAVDSIRLYDENGLVICGSGDYTRHPEYSISNPVKDPINENKGKEAQIAYSIHIYIGSHDNGSAAVSNGNPALVQDEDYTGPNVADGGTSPWSMKNRLRESMRNGRAVYITEWGVDEVITISEETFMPFVDKYKIGWAEWDLSNKLYGLAAFNPLAPVLPPNYDEATDTYSWNPEDMTRVGNYMRSVLRGEPVPMYDDQTVITNYETGAFMGNYSNTLTAEVPAELNGNKAVKLSNANKNLAENWANFADVNKMYGPYQDLNIDVYMSADKLATANSTDTVIVFEPMTDTVIVFEPMLTLPKRPWASINVETEVKIPEPFAVPYSAFEDVGGGLLKANVRIPLAWPGLAQPRGTTVPPAVYSGNRDITQSVKINFALTDKSDGSVVYLDNIAFASYNNGDRYKSDAVYSSQARGSIITPFRFPFRFESFITANNMYQGQRSKEGWGVRSGGGVPDVDMTVEEVEEGNHAFAFPLRLIPDGMHNRWEYGAALVSPTIPSPWNTRAYWDANCAAITLDVYIEPNNATQGNMLFNISSNNFGSEIPIIPAVLNPVDPKDGEYEEIVTADGRTLWKFKVVEPYSNETQPWLASHPTDRTTNIRIFLNSTACDYKGMMYLDNIGVMSKAEYNEWASPLISNCTSPIVSGCGANIMFTAQGKDENLDGKSITGTLFGKEFTFDKNGVALLKLGSEDVPDVTADTLFQYVLYIDGVEAKSGDILVKPLNINIWTLTVKFAENDEPEAVFNTNITPIAKGYSVKVNGNPVAAEQTAVNTLSVKTTNYDKAGGNTLIISGVKYADLFPSYSFTFTATF